jgi:L-fucose mutarotase/ribose pyranase (RbsD/FucU family)
MRESDWSSDVCSSDLAAKAFAVVMTGETVKYGNIILIKGVTPVL